MKTKVAIVGSGFGMYGLLPSFSQIDGCKVVSICGKNSERMINYCKKFGLNRYTNWKEMLQKEKPDAVAIAVIPIYQYEIAKYALDNGIAVFAEKPLTTSIQTSLKLAKLAKEKKLPNMIDFIFPEIFEWDKTKKTIESGVLGKIINIDVEWKFLSYDLKNQVKSWKTDVSQGGGALSFYFSHVFYYLENFLGKIKNLEYTSTSSKKSVNKGETGVNMSIVFENGSTGNVHMDISYVGQPKHSVEFRGEKGSMTLQNFSDNFVENFELIINTKKEKERIISDKDNAKLDKLGDPRIKMVKPIAERFIKWCNENVVSKPTFEDGLRVEELIEMARNSNLKKQ